MRSVVNLSILIHSFHQLCHTVYISHRRGFLVPNLLVLFHYNEREHFFLRLPRAVFVRSQKVRIFPKLFISLDGVIFHNISARLGQHFYSRWHFVISICFNEIRVHPMDFNDSNNEHHHNERKTKEKL